jgi:peptide/nickel transport system substrate-binding protein
MRKKVFWVFLMLLTVVAMVLSSCKSTEPATTEEGSTTTITGTTSEAPPAPPVEKPPDTTRSEKPQYGGSVTLALTADLTGFDEVFVAHNLAITLHLTNEELLQGDWTKGPAGSNEANFILGGINNMDLKAGSLADSWEIPERGKMVFHIREGVYWQNKAPTNGRELTVDDVVFSIQRMCTTSTSYIKMAYPTLAKSAVITGDNATRTVTIEVPLTEWANAVTLFPDFLSIMPRDAIEKFGDLNDWRNSIGTGPFIMTDYVSNGSVTFTKNDNYWGTNPIGPGKGDRLPYIDSAKFLIITDTATLMTAFRTAKIDGVGAEYDDAKEFLDNPNIKSMMYTSDSSYVIGMRTDKPDSPFSKKEVRQALFYATDFNKIKDDFYSGKSVILNWPICYARENADAYVPMEKLPAETQALFSHDVTKAKDLLTAAGYPTGINVTLVTYNTATFVDIASLLKQMWAEAGINLTIDARDYVTWISRVKSRNYGANELLYSYTSGAWQKMINFNGASQYNVSYINDTKVAEAAAKASEYIGTEEDKLAQVNADLMPYVIEQCWVWSKPTAYSYVVWWPWRKNWNGELNVGYYNYPSYLKYTWTDLTMRKEMTGR